MAKYLVWVKEVWERLEKVEAESESEAIEKAKRCEGFMVDNSEEYCRTLDSSLWTVTKEEEI